MELLRCPPIPVMRFITDSLFSRLMLKIKPKIASRGMWSLGQGNEVFNYVSKRVVTSGRFTVKLQFPTQSHYFNMLASSWRRRRDPCIPLHFCWGRRPPERKRMCADAARFSADQQSPQVRYHCSDIPCQISRFQANCGTKFSIIVNAERVKKSTKNRTH